MQNIYWCQENSNQFKDDKAILVYYDFDYQYTLNLSDKSQGVFKVKRKDFFLLYRCPPYLPSIILSNKQKHNGCLLKGRQWLFIAHTSELQSERAVEADKYMRQNQMDDLTSFLASFGQNRKDLTLLYMIHCINFYTAHVLSKIKSICFKAMSCTNLISVPYWS